MTTNLGCMFKDYYNCALMSACVTYTLTPKYATYIRERLWGRPNTYTFKMGNCELECIRRMTFQKTGESRVVTTV